MDFGTTNSEVAIFKAGRAAVMADPQGRAVIPSAVFIGEDGTRHVGQGARNISLLHPERTVMSVKRDLGSGSRYRIDGHEYTPEEITSFIMAELKAMAERALGVQVERAVLTVPAYFDDRRRQAVIRAAALAGLEVVRLVNEPTAAALAYGVDGHEQGHILVYDLGGGTFDVSVLLGGDGVFQVLATRGDPRLGGDDFDARIAELLLGRFKEETGMDLRGDRLALQKIYMEAERAKLLLSERIAVDVEIPFIAAGRQGPCHLETRITREELEGLVESFLERTIRLTKGALQDAGLSPRGIDRVLLVGGSTRMPAVRSRVQDLLGRPAESGVSPEEVVARGAATEAGILAGQARRTVLVDVTPLGLGVETADRKMVTLVPRNTVLPARAKALFSTVSDYQTAAGFHVFQGERPRAQDNTLLGSFRLENIERGLRGSPDIEVCFEVDVDGFVHVSARDLATGSCRKVDLEGALPGDLRAAQDTVVEARAAELEDTLAGLGEAMR
jgi:molecular chaperone DnaK